MKKYKVGNEAWILLNDKIDNVIISRTPIKNIRKTYEVMSLKTLKTYKVEENLIFSSQKEVFEEYNKRKESSHVCVGAF